MTPPVTAAFSRWPSTVGCKEWYKNMEDVAQAPSKAGQAKIDTVANTVAGRYKAREYPNKQASWSTLGPLTFSAYLDDR
jgi:hypothetical protein